MKNQGAVTAKNAWMRASAALACAVAACAHVPDAHERALIDARAKMHAAGAALVADGCVMRASGVEQYYLIGDSRRVASIAAKAGGALLRQQNVPLKGLQVPYFCGSLAINPVRNARVADAADLTERQADLPMVLAEPVSRDAALAESYRRLLYAARAEPATLSGELLTEAQAQQLKQHLGSPVVMVVMLWGQSVSTAVDVPKVSGCAVFASVCGRGFTPDLDKSRALASVFDLDARAVIWTQVIRFPLGDASLLFAGGDPARMDNYSGLGWMEDLTRPFFR